MATDKPDTILLFLAQRVSSLFDPGTWGKEIQRWLDKYQNAASRLRNIHACEFVFLHLPQSIQVKLANFEPLASSLQYYGRIQNILFAVIHLPVMMLQYVYHCCFQRFAPERPSSQTLASSLGIDY